VYRVYIGAKGTDARWVGQRCRVLFRFKGPGPRNALVEFADGTQVVVPTYGGGRIGATLRLPGRRGT
jgi:hypothetical protein